MMSNHIEPFPHLTPTTRKGDARCGSRSAEGAPECGAPATWHVAWTLTTPAQFSLHCDTHMAFVQQHMVYADRHPVAVACDMPGTGWLTTDPSLCTLPPGAD
jgi:hypothetical protein